LYNKTQKCLQILNLLRIKAVFNITKIFIGLDLYKTIEVYLIFSLCLLFLSVHWN